MHDVNPQNPKCVQDGSFFCHGNTNYCHGKGYRELCCKTCENWRPENAKAAVEGDNLDLAPASGQFDNEMANVDVGADDMEVFNAEWNKISAQHQQQPNKRSYSEG